MGLYRRKDARSWWLSFTVGGKLYRRPTETDNRKLAEKIFAKIQTQIVEGRWFDVERPKNIKMVEVIDKFMTEISSLQEGSHEWELCKENPVRKIMKSLPQESKRVRYVLPEEAEILKSTIPAWLKPIVIAACQTGLRRGNLAWLTISQLDLTTNRIIVDKTKNGDLIGIAMTSIVRKILLDVIRERKVVSPYVFCDDQGKPHSPYKVSVAFKRACRRAKVENLRLHDLRHDFATLMLRKTKNLVDVQHAMGHKDSRMTLRYAHLLPDDLRDAYEAIDNEGTASIISRFLHDEEKPKGSQAVTL